MDVKSSQVTGNAALHYVAWQLSRHGWNVMLTARNSKGSDLFCSNDAETIFFGVQSKGLTKRDPVGLAGNLDNLWSEWWIITIKAKTNEPVCFIMTLDEVKALCHRSDPANSSNGKVSMWLQPTAYDRLEFREAWHRFGTEAQPSVESSEGLLNEA